MITGQGEIARIYSRVHSVYLHRPDFGIGRAFRPFSSSLVMEIAGILLGIWAIVVMGWRNVNVSPLVKRDARLVTKGPYASIRHPMYSAVLLTLWPLIIDRYSLFRLAVGLILTVDLLLKIRYEEGLLKKRFPEYEAYMKVTKRLIPFVL